MKNRGLLTSLISLLVVFVFTNILIFLLIPDDHFELASFWIAWSFAFPLCVLTSVGITWYSTRLGNATIVKLPLLFTVHYAFVSLYFIAGLIFMILGLESTTPIWVTEIIISAIYILLMLYSFTAASYISQNVKRTKAKVFYIKSLQKDVEGCIPLANDENISNLLRGLADKIRFSDPMSHESLQPIEQQIQDLVLEIMTAVSMGNLDGVPALITKASVLVDSRNGKCQVLK